MTADNARQPQSNVKVTWKKSYSTLIVSSGVSQTQLSSRNNIVLDTMFMVFATSSFGSVLLLKAFCSLKYFTSSWSLLLCVVRDIVYAPLGCIVLSQRVDVSMSVVSQTLFRALYVQENCPRHRFLSTKCMSMLPNSTTLSKLHQIVILSFFSWFGSLFIKQTLIALPYLCEPK